MKYCELESVKVEGALLKLTQSMSPDSPPSPKSMPSSSRFPQSIWKKKKKKITLNLWHADFILINTKNDSHFRSFPSNEMAQVVETIPNRTQGPVFCTWSITWPLMTWWLEMPRHQQLWYWTWYPRIFWFSTRRVKTSILISLPLIQHPELLFLLVHRRRGKSVVTLPPWRGCCLSATGTQLCYHVWTCTVTLVDCHWPNSHWNRKLNISYYVMLNLSEKTKRYTCIHISYHTSKLTCHMFFKFAPKKVSCLFSSWKTSSHKRPTVSGFPFHRFPCTRMYPNRVECHYNAVQNSKIHVLHK